MFNFFNTNRTKGSTLVQAIQKCEGQQDAVLEIFRQSDRALSPSDVHGMYRQYQDVPLTSIRRAMSNLTKKGELTKTPQVKEGPYGKNEHLWSL